jgi:hypothetical protein
MGRLGLSTAANCSAVTAARLQIALRYGSKTASNRLRELANDFQKISDELSRAACNFQTLLSIEDMLLTILYAADEICVNHLDELTTMLGRIQNSQMDPNTRASMRISLERLGKYKPAASRLLRYARRHSMFRDIELHIVCMNPINLRCSLADQSNKSRAGLLNRHLAFPKKKRKHDMVLAMQAFQACHGGTVEEWASRMRERATNLQAQYQYKVHAEMQLIFDYEGRENVEHRPRVVKSSKSACFLCNLFMKVYGKVYTPKSHGRVYERWMLPDLPILGLKTNKLKELEQLVDRFNIAVEDTLLKEMAKKKQSMAHPRESSTFNLAPSIQTIASDKSVSSNETMKPAEIPVHLATSPTRQSSSGSSTSRRTSQSSSRDWHERAIQENELQSPITPMTPAPAGDESIATDQPAICWSPEPSLTRQSGQAIDLRPGQPFVHVFSTDSPTIRICSRKIHIDLSRCMARLVASGSSSKHSYCNNGPISIEIEWLEMNMGHANLPIEHDLSVDLLQPWAALEVPEGVVLDGNSLMLRRKQEVIRLRGTYVRTQGD